MRVAILNPGPSLAKWPVEVFAAYDLRVGVNRAASRITSCDYWAFIDWTLFVQYQPAYHPGVITATEAVRGLERRGQSHELLEYGSPLLLESFLDAYPIQPGKSWSRYTCTTAMVAAAWLGASSIDLYGADWTDEPDFDGVTLPSNQRSESRWAGERVVYAATVEQIGIPCERKLWAC